MIPPRVIGVDDGHFVRGRDATVPIFGVLMRGPVVEGALMRVISVDGDDATEKIIDMVSGRFSSQPRYILLSASVFGGTNIVDMNRVFRETGIPVASVVRKKPTPDFLRALERSPRGKRKTNVASRNPPPVPLETPRGVLYVQVVGADTASIKTLIAQYQLSSLSLIPEPLRLAHIFATAATLGDSRGRP